MSEPKIGVFVCYCGGNISDYVDVEHVRDELAKEPGVAIAATNMFTCSDEAQQNMITKIQEEKLDGIVVASCSPKLHLGTFRAMSERASLNKYMYQQVNIREQCSWTHTDDREGATEKAIRLVRAGVAKVYRSEPLEDIRIDTVPRALVIGGGVSGMRSAIGLADLGLEVFLVEREEALGGQIAKWGPLFPSSRQGSELVEVLQKDIAGRDKIHVMLGSRVVSKAGSVGKFSVDVEDGAGKKKTLEVGAIVVATGFHRYEPKDEEFGYGGPGVVTLEQFRGLLADGGKGPIQHNGRAVHSVAYIYCVGSRQGDCDGCHPYCSRYCCTAAVHTSLLASDRDPSLRQYHLYRDLRTYGSQELLYEESLSKGSLYLKFDAEEPPEVTVDGEQPKVAVKDLLTAGERIEMEPDLVVLVTGMEARDDPALVDVLKIPLDKNGFFNEIHPKLRPVETVMDGIFITGASQGPKNIPEAVASALAGTAKAAGLLLKGYVDLEPYVAEVHEDKCTWCGACEEACLYSAIEKVSAGGKEVARVNAALCKGCGACAAVCEADALDLKGFSDDQIKGMIDALTKEVA